MRQICKIAYTTRRFQLPTLHSLQRHHFKWTI